MSRTLLAVLALDVWLVTAPAQAAAQPRPIATRQPHEDRVAVGWMLGAGSNLSAESDVVTEISVFGDVPLRHGRFRVSADLARWGFTTSTPGLGLTRSPDFRDTAALRRVAVQALRQVEVLPDDTLSMYYGTGAGAEFWRYDSTRVDGPSAVGVLGVAGVEYLKPGGRVGLLTEARLSFSLGPVVTGSSAFNVTWLAGVKWRLTAPRP